MESVVIGRVPLVPFSLGNEICSRMERRALSARDEPRRVCSETQRRRDEARTILAYSPPLVHRRLRDRAD
jgi:hypothetical protein